MAEQRVSGFGVSDGIRFGKVLLYRQEHAAPSNWRETIAPEEAATELNRMQQAKAQTEAELRELIEKTKQTLGENKASILAGQQSFLADPTFYPEMEKRVQNQLLSAEAAVQQVVNHFANLLESMPQEYLRERAADVKDVGLRLLNHLRGEKGRSLADIREEVILVADDLTPSDTVQLNKQYILGIVTRIGGKTSHTAILAKSLGIPAVLGIGQAFDNFRDGERLILDGTAGLVILNPNDATSAEYRGRFEREQEEWQALQALAEQPAVTRDGRTVELAANIGTPAESKGILEQGAEAIGLYRTEFLFMISDRLPTEEEQFIAYRDVAQNMSGRPVVIRTLDIGGDKELPYLSLQKEMNPFLGYRAIRLCLDQKELLVTQLRAILRASHFGKLKVMFPMIASLTEWRQAKAIWKEVQAQLLQEGVPFDETMEVGIMVEVPSSAVLADLFADEVDFFSIGTNDLVQYTLAVDRMNEKVAYLYDYFHPAVLRLIQNVIRAAHAKGKWVGMCGGMAGDPWATPLLLGLGLDEFSMAASSVKKVKHLITRVHLDDCVTLAEEVMKLNQAEKIRERLEQFVGALDSF